VSDPTGRPTKPGPSTFAIGLGVGFVVMTAISWRTTELSLGWSGFLNDNRALQALPHADLGQLFSERSRGPFLDTLRMAVLGSVFGTLVAMPLAMASSRHGVPWKPARWALRAFNNVIRAFPDILWAMFFVAAVGIGNLPGVLALFFFSIAVVTKLMTDTLDAIDTAPLEAADAVGASWVRTQRVAVLPQILPAYVSYALYAFELNIRGSAVLGLVGAGGIGARLEFFRGRGDWEELWGIVVMFLIVVFLLDQLSAFLRRRLV